MAEFFSTAGPRQRHCILICWLVFTAKLCVPACLGRIIMNVLHTQSLRTAVQVRVALLPLEQWLTVTLVILAFLVFRRHIRRQEEESPTRLLLTWIPLILGLVLIFHEWFWQYPSLIDMIGVYSENNSRFLRPLGSLGNP